MINPKARAEDYINGFGLTPHEFELVRTLPDSSHCFLIKHGKESVVARLDLTGEQELLTILSGRESTVRLFDSLVAEDGLPPEDWITRLLRQAA
jgi:type IV secretion system protein VirB4